jgi:anti-sigma regulatory factor (Ser/Thr protein kinase)/ActR/RegA family two-component response regulator
MATDPTQAPSLPESQRALVVSSSPELDKLLSDIFNQSQWAFEFVADNKAALDRASAEKFDLIITGERTTGKEDVELLRRLRLVRPHTRLIILTEEFVTGDVVAAIRERAFSYFARPFSTEKLNEIIHVAMTEPFWDDGIEILSATPNWVRLCVRCDPVTANRLIQFFREASDLPDVETEEVATAFREILLNAIEHGGNLDPSQHVEIGYIRTRRMVMCRVKDPGKGFSLNELKHAALTNPPEDPFQHMAVREERGLRPGGFGILMAKKLVDELLYNEKGNEVILVKNLDTPKATEYAP